MLYVVRAPLLAFTFERWPWLIRHDMSARLQVITEGILLKWITHRKPDMSDLYLIHQQGWEGAAEHVSQPARIAWKSMCATREGKEKGEWWCKRAIWGNALAAFKRTWKSVDNVTSEAFVCMWRGRVAEFYTKYVALPLRRQARNSVVGRALPRLHSP